MTIIVLITVFATLLLVVAVSNLIAGERRIRHQVERLYSIGDPDHLRVMNVLLGPPMSGDNHCAALVNGRRIFAAMLADIGSARHSVCFETFIYWSGSIGRQFTEALSARARAGVKVHVLLDWVGTLKLDDALLACMRDAGVEVRRFHKPAWYSLGRMNNRTHRKLLIVDGRVGFTGGVGIADQWQGDAEDETQWRDTHFRALGPVVAQMQAVFIDNWIKATGRVLHGREYFPRLESAGVMAAQMFSSSPSGGSESMHLMYLMSLTAAKWRIDLACAYFIPDGLTLHVILDALARGVRVRIVTPGRHIDSSVVRFASQASWERLLAAGAEIHEYEPTMYHCKVMIVDELLVSVGSTNFDNRSFRLNDEANLNLYDQHFAREQVAIFEDDLQKARRIDLERWQQRAWHRRVRERAAFFVSAQL